MQPTSPLRNYIDVKKSIKLFNKNNEKPLVSVKKQMFVFTNSFIKKNFLKPFFEKKMTISRQKVPTSYEVNGAIYIFKVKSFKKKEVSYRNSITFLMKV